MANLTITYDEIKDVAARLRQGQDDMNAKLTELGSLVDSLVAGGFQAEHAARAFDDTFDQFQTSTKQAVDALEGLSGFLDSAADALQQTDVELGNAIKG